MRIHRLIALLAVFALMFAIGCSQQRANTASVKDGLEKQFEQAKLDNINIDEDREHKVLTLKGEVDSPALKQQAGEIANAAAPGWTVANEIAVSATEEMMEEGDKVIKERIDQAFDNNKQFEDIDVRVKQGVVTLSGDAKSVTLIKAAEKLVKSMDGVKQVVVKTDVDRPGTDMDRDGHRDTAKPGDDPSSKKN